MKLPESRWIEIQKSALVHNYQQVQNAVGPAVKVLAVVKANAYGLGMVPCAQLLQEQGAAMLGVTTFEEGIALRKAGLKLPILVFGPVLQEQVGLAATYRLTISITSPQAVDRVIEGMEKLALEAAGAVEPISVHLKVETGMGRFGIWPKEAAAAARAIAGHPGLRLEGVYTHFATANQSRGAYFQKQWSLFQEALHNLKEAGFSNLIRHCANSAAIIAFPDCYLDMVRCGTMLYGQKPVVDQGKEIKLQDPWRFLARVLEVRTLPAGHGIGYGVVYRTKKASRIAVLPVGIVDGVNMEPVLQPTGIKDVIKGTAKLWLRYLKIGRQNIMVKFEAGAAPVVGKVGMQLLMVDVTHLPQVEIGSVAQVPLRRTAAGQDIPRHYV
jgi:alanine racemase